MSTPNTSTAAVEALAVQFDDEARHIETARALEDADHVAWCAWMQRSAATLRAIAAERDAARAEVAALRDALTNDAAVEAFMRGFYGSEVGFTKSIKAGLDAMVAALAGDPA